MRHCQNIKQNKIYCHCLRRPADDDLPQHLQTHTHTHTHTPDQRRGRIPDIVGRHAQCGRRRRKGSAGRGHVGGERDAGGGIGSGGLIKRGMMIRRSEMSKEMRYPAQYINESRKK